MSPSIRVTTNPGEAHVAVVQSGRLIDYTLWRLGTPDGVGDVHRGRITAMVPAMAGAFVALQDAEGFLPDSEGAKGCAVGRILTVRITRAPQGGKGPRLSAKGLAEIGVNAPVGLLARGPDPLHRLAERYPAAPILVDDPGLAAGIVGKLRERVSVGADVLPEDVAGAIDALHRPVIDTSTGARLSFWPTPALVAIDVDAAAALSHAPHQALNRALLPDLAEQIRLRNFSGGIVVDVAGLSVRRRAALAPDFVAALANDKLHPRFLGFTALGLAEILRPRIHPPLHELLEGPLAAGLAGLRAMLAAYRPDRADRRCLRAHPAIVTALQKDAAGLRDVQRHTGHVVSLRSDPSLPPAGWVVEEEHA